MSLRFPDAHHALHASSDSISPSASDPPFAVELKPLAYAWMAAHPNYRMSNDGAIAHWNDTHRERAFIAWSQERHRRWPGNQDNARTPKARRRLRRQFVRSALKQALSRLRANCLDGERVDHRFGSRDIAEWFEAVVQLPSPHGRAFFAEREDVLLLESKHNRRSSSVEPANAVARLPHCTPNA